jgi:uncharacterized protein
MINPYEIVSKSALPALRAMVSKRMREGHHLTQQQVALRLGVTQASISNYSRKARGVMIDLELDPNVAKAADRIADLLATGSGDQMEALRAMTEVCDYIRFNHLMCSLHHDLEPGFNTEGCDACDGVINRKDFGRLRLAAGQ